MTSKLKCPVCNAELAEWEDLYACTNDHCPWVGNAELWQALTQAKQDLERLQKAVGDALNVMAGLKSALEHANHQGTAELLAKDIERIKQLIKD